jgi:hypothetical protein
VWAGVTLARVWSRSTIIKTAVAFLLLVQVTTAVYTSDHVSFFNHLVPTTVGGNIIADSNLSWGQSLIRLRQDINPSQVDYLVTMSPAPASWYGFTTQTLPVAEELTAPDITQLKNQTAVIDRHLWYTRGYSAHPIFASQPTKLVADDTMILITFTQVGATD